MSRKIQLQVKFPSKLIMLLKSCKILNGCLVIKKTRTESFNSGFKSGRMDSNHRYPAPKAGAIAARRRPESTKASICEKENEVNSKCKFCYCFSKVKASRKEWFCICFLVWLGKKINKRLYTPFEFAL